MIPRAIWCSPKQAQRLRSSSIFAWDHFTNNFKLGERALHIQSATCSPFRNRKDGQGQGKDEGQGQSKATGLSSGSDNKQCRSPGQSDVNSPGFPATKYRPRRALMYVPGSDAKKIRKIPTLEADCIVLDCEDGVAVTKKSEARKLIRETLDNPEIDFGRSERTVRVNSVDSGLCEEDLREILSVKRLPTSILIPKVESKEQIKWFLSKATALLQGRKKSLPEPINLILFIESGQALLSAVEITRGALEVCRGTQFLPDALVFGSDDYCASIGATRTNSADEISYARQYVGTVARAHHLQAIDIVYIDFKDQAGLIKQAVAGASMGYTGKQVIHPTQVSICHEAFSPSLDKIHLARKLLKEFEKHTESGKGAFTFNDCSVDMPVVLQARNIVQLAETLQSSVGQYQNKSKKEDDDDDADEKDSKDENKNIDEETSSPEERKSDNKLKPKPNKK